MLAVGLVVWWYLLFLRSGRATIVAGVTLPLSLIATFGMMYLAGFSLNNLSLMALTIGTGFVVDDAIVMIENIVRKLEDGRNPLDAALEGAREIGFTVISLTFSLIAFSFPCYSCPPCGPHVPRICAHADHSCPCLGGRIFDADTDDVRAIAQEREAEGISLPADRRSALRMDGLAV